MKSIIVKKYNHNENKKVDDTNKKNLLEQNFKAEKSVGYITYIYTKETGWTYLAIVIDLFDLKVIGWSYGINMKAELVISAFKKAKLAIFEFIKSWYNNTRIHSTIGYKTPNEKYNEYIENIA